jgi:hypothetical protein
MAGAAESSQAAEKKEVTNLTARDLEILSAAWNCMKTQPEVSYAKAAAPTIATAVLERPSPQMHPQLIMLHRIYTRTDTSLIDVAAQMDYEKLANACGMTNPRSASNAWSSIKKKLFANVPAAAVDKDGKGPKTPGRKRKTKAEETTAPAADGSEEDKKEDAATPAKKKRATPAKKKAPKSAAKVKDEGSGDEDKKEVKAKVKKAKAAVKAEPKSDEDMDSDEGPEGAEEVPVTQVDDGEV